MKIYLASNWRNRHFPAILKLLRGLGHEVYDFRSGEDNWFETERSRKWSPVEYRDALGSAEACSVFRRDMKALAEADVTVLLTPSGRSAHLELGAAYGMGQRVAVVLTPGFKPELMFKMVNILAGPEELVAWLSEINHGGTTAGTVMKSAGSKTAKPVG